jgi:hypothetical protein
MFFSKTRKWKNGLLLVIAAGIGLIITPFFPWFTETNGWTGTNSYSLAGASFPQAFILMLAGGSAMGFALALLGDNSRARLPIYYGSLVATGLIAITVTVVAIVSPPSIGLGLLQNESTPLKEGIMAAMFSCAFGMMVLTSGVETFLQGRRDTRSNVDPKTSGDTFPARVRSKA